MATKKKATKGKKTETETAEAKPPLPKKVEDAVFDVLHNTSESLALLEEIGKMPSRELAIVMTKLEEAEMWLHNGLTKLGYDENPDEDEGDDEDDAEDDAEAEDEESE